MKFISALLLAATVLIATITVSSAAADTCSSVSGLQPSCSGGSITQDSVSGSCRTIVCSGSGSSMRALACDKGGVYELYRQERTGTAVSSICLGGACVGNSGFARSDYPACTTAEAPQPRAGESCSSVRDVPLSCSSTVTADSTSGSCRKVTCGEGGNSITALACDKGGSFEVYRQSQSGSAPRVCFGTTCIQDNGFARSDGYTCEGSSAPVVSTTAGYPLKRDIVSTIFWVGQGPSADTGWSHNYDSAWDTWWVEHYGGYDDPNSRNGYRPAGFTPKENPFYVAIPYTDFSDVGRKGDAFSVVPWAGEKSWGYQESMIKNRWVKVIKNGKAVYAQVENSGPGPTDDHRYVFGSNAQPTTDFGWKAGIDVSPAVRDYLGLGPVDKVDWQWVEARDVPSGPWKDIVTTRQSCWASRIEDCR